MTDNPAEHDYTEVRIHLAEEGGFWAEIPDLPGCVSQGETYPQLFRNLAEAVELWGEPAADETAAS